MYRKIYLSILLTLLSFAFSLTGQETVSKPINNIDGDNYFSIEALFLTYVPLFSWDPFTSGGTGIDSTQVKLGHNFALSWRLYIQDDISVGFRAGGIFTEGVNGDSYYIIDFRPTIQNEFYINSTFYIPYGVGIGPSWHNYQEKTYMLLTIAPSAGFFWKASNRYHLGVKADYLFSPEIYFDEANSHMSSINNALSVTAMISLKL